MSESTNSIKRHKILTVIGWILCAVLIPILIFNCTLLAKSYINKNKAPDFLGVLPFIVLTDSMYPDIKSGDLIFCKAVQPADIKKGDVISFYDPQGNGTSVITHTVVEIMNDGGKLSFRTKGINNNTEDRLPVPAEKVIARYTGIRLAGAGNLAIFMQSTAGLIVCVVLPLILLVGYDVIRRKIYEKNKSDDIDLLLAELNALRAASAEKEYASPPQGSSEQKGVPDPAEN